MNYETDERYYKKLKALHMIFKENLTQQDVAKMLKISRPTLAKLISEAIDEGILKIEINDVRNLNSLLDLERQVKRIYGLYDVK